MTRDKGRFYALLRTSYSRSQMPSTLPKTPDPPNSFSSSVRICARPVRSGTHKSIVRRMRADPDPRDSVCLESAQGAIVITHPDAEAICAALQPAEMQRRVMGVTLPQAVILDC